DVVALLLHPEGDRELPEEELARAGGERRIQDLAVLAVGAVVADADAGAPVPDLLAIVVEGELARPAVVSLPGVGAALEEEVGAAPVGDDERDVALPAPVLRRQLPEIDAAGPVVRDRDLNRGLPSALSH